MKKTIAFLVAAFGVSFAHAAEPQDPLTVYSQENAEQLQAEYEFDLQTLLDEAALLDESAAALQQRRGPGGGRDQVGRRGPQRPPQYGRGDRDDRRPPVYRRAPPRRPVALVTCYARNARGFLFSASARFPQAAHQMAMNRCYQYSRICRPAGCRWF